jgi:predicted MFS family arabinose efflux permease
MAASEITAPAPGYRAAFATPEFGPLFTAYVLSLMGDVVAAVALTVLVFERTGSPFLAGLTFTLAFVPSLIGGTLLSALVERLPPRRLMVGCDLLSAAMVVAMAAGHAPVWALLALLAALGLVSPIQNGTRNAVLGAILPGDSFVAGRSLFRVVAQSAQVVGNATGGLLLAFASPRGALGVDAATFVASALLVRFGTRARPARAGAAPRGSLLGDSLSGVRSVLAAPLLRRVLLLGWFVPALSVAPESLAAASVHELGRSGAAVGLWLAALPIGVIAGEIAAIRLLSPERRPRVVVPLAAWVFVPLLVFALEPRVELAIPLLVLSGLGHGYSLGLDTLIIRNAEGVLRDRVFTVFSAGLMAIQGLGFAAAGALAELVSPHVAIVVAGVVGLATVALLRPRPAAAAVLVLEQ